MKFLVILFLAAIAVARTEQQQQEECGEERAEACVDNLLSSLVGDSTEEEVCRELKTSVECLKAAVDECVFERVSDAEVDEVKEGIEQLENVFKKNCEEDVQQSQETEDLKDTETANCFQENEDYLFECVIDSTAEALSAAAQSGELDDGTGLQCAMYHTIGECFVERIAAKCGQEAADLAIEELKDLPTEIQEDCDAVGEIQTHDFQLLDKKRK